MDNSMINLKIGQTQYQKIFFWYGNLKKSINKSDLLNFLLSKSFRTLYTKSFYNDRLKAYYDNAYDFIIKHIDEIDNIQVYRDNAIHLWFGKRHFSHLIVFEDYDFCNNKQTSDLLDELIIYICDN